MLILFLSPSKIGVEEPIKHGEKGGWDIPIGIPIVEIQYQLKNELSKYISLCTCRLVYR